MTLYVLPASSETCSPSWAFIMSSFFLGLTVVPILVGFVLSMISSVLLMTETSLIPFDLRVLRYVSSPDSCEAPLAVTLSTPTWMALVSSWVWFSIS